MRYLDKKNQRLVYIQQAATPNFWDSFWHTERIRDKIIDLSKYSFIPNITKKFLMPEDGPILEGGCGNAYNVYALYKEGFNCIGVDFAEKTIRLVNESFPELDVRVGDVRKLNFPDNYFAGYWSLGVIEHFWDGYEEIAAEMRRVIKPNGYLFVGFPYMSPVRRLKAKLNMYEIYDKQKTDNFYQFALNIKNVRKYFEKLGFSLIGMKRSDGIKGAIEEFSFLKKPLLMLFRNLV